ncbi:phosphotransferase enzyme family-domain-containing protein [Colletotrichum phormii]|uniref:Phosphotransferase enzyme family-domain-containing protein n=1 Tax=Colletotrichum phormii TaxID=359342 RepID=A0AAJ0EFH5_9PEZI|nr:phosphotransferase enzyme family-domain-containing protein [Colletotrichum phormii]KAK1634990.1 phosphotransferase enzyme family-domain-containing protein [Colletotrichum phormii]
MNHERYQDRLDLVNSVIHSYGLKPVEITPIDYDETSPFAYNNYIYKITLSAPLTPSSFPDGRRRPYTQLPPAEGISTVVMRIANPKAEGVVQETRVENEVAAIHLARQGLASYKPEIAGLMPALYDWRPYREGEGGYGWGLMEFKEGVPLDTVFRDLDDGEKDDVLGQIADVVTGIQRVSLPESVKTHGGLSIDERGRIVGGKMTTLKGGPWGRYSDFWKARLVLRLEDADASPALEGWRPNGVRERVDRFLEDGLERYLDGSGVDGGKLALIHGDLTTNNTLYDTTTKKLTSILDFDFAFISHPCHEFFISLGDVGGNTGGGTGRDSDLSGGLLGKAMLTGDFDGIRTSLPQEAAGQLTRAKAWDDALKERGALRPSEIAGMAALDGLRRLEALACPFALEHPVMLRRKTREEIEEMRGVAEGELVECLEGFGY